MVKDNFIILSILRSRDNHLFVSKHNMRIKNITIVFHQIINYNNGWAKFSEDKKYFFFDFRKLIFTHRPTIKHTNMVPFDQLLVAFSLASYL